MADKINTVTAAELDRCAGEHKVLAEAHERASKGGSSDQFWVNSEKVLAQMHRESAGVFRASAGRVRAKNKRVMKNA